MDENFLKNPAGARELLEKMTRRATPFVFDIFPSSGYSARLTADQISS
jgi:hypothetical protein